MRDVVPPHAGLSLKGFPMTDDDVLRVRENYRPSRGRATPARAFAHWTGRVADLPDLAVCRELAGLPDEQLRALALEFERAPHRSRSDVFRFSFGAAAVFAFAAAALAIAEMTVPGPAVGRSSYFIGAGVFAAAAIAALCLGALSALRQVPVDAAYGRLGLLVGLLDEQHPWLYKAYFVLRNPAAMAYRDKVLRERGPIRGMDHVLMRQIAELQESLELTQNARAVAAAVQAASGVLADAGTHSAPADVTVAAPAPSAPSLTAVPAKVLTLGTSSEAA